MSRRTLLEACEWARLPYPCSDAELRKVIVALYRRGITHNLETETFVREILRAERLATWNLAQKAIKRAKAGMTVTK